MLQACEGEAPLRPSTSSLSCSMRVSNETALDSTSGKSSMARIRTSCRPDIEGSYLGPMLLLGRSTRIDSHQWSRRFLGLHTLHLLQPNDRIQPIESYTRHKTHWGHLLLDSDDMLARLLQRFQPKPQYSCAPEGQVGLLRLGRAPPRIRIRSRC